MSLHLIDWYQFTKWYEAVPLPDQTAATRHYTLFERWIFRFGCQYSVHTDHGSNFESQLFGNLSRKLEIDKTRTTAYHPPSNTTIEQMNRIFLNMVAKCIDKGQIIWSVKLPYVLKAYRSSVHESTGFTLHSLVFGHEISLPQDLMYRPPPFTTPIDVHVCVYQKKKLSARLVSLLDAMVLPSNAVATTCAANVYMAPHTKQANRFFFTNPLFNLEKVQNFPFRVEPLRKFEMFKHR